MSLCVYHIGADIIITHTRRWQKNHNQSRLFLKNYVIHINVSVQMMLSYIVIYHSRDL